MAVYRTKRGINREGAGAVKLGDEYEELYVISDLHLSPPGGARMFDNGEELAAFIDYVAAIQPKTSTGRIGLVLNGDVVDFITEKESKPFNPYRAVETLEALAKKPDDSAKVDPRYVDAKTYLVFQALGDFVKKDKHRLVVALGNHDIELAMPWVQEAFAKAIGVDDTPESDAWRGRLVFATDGTGYRAQVGRARVLCVHGNEVDDWNYVSQKELKAAQAAILAGQPFEFEGNAGTKLVLEVLNGLCRDGHPYVSLLKPETSTVPPIVLALQPSKLTEILNVLKAVARLASRTARREGGWLGEADMGEEYDPNGRLAPPLASAAELMMMAEANVYDGVDPLSLVDQSAMLGPGGVLMKSLKKLTQRSLSAVLSEWLKDDKTFEPATLSSFDKAIDAAVGKEINVLIAGHTHLARAAKRANGGGFYFNSGTWARLMRVEKEHLQDAAKLDELLAMLRTAGTFEELTKDGGPTYNHPTAVCVRDGKACLATFDMLREPELRLEAVAKCTYQID